MTAPGAPTPPAPAADALAAVPPGLQVPAHAAASAGIGLLAGIGFTIPALTYLHTAANTHRTLLLLLAAACAILLVRRAGRLLRPVLDGAPQPWRLPLLGLYGLAAMSLPASLLLGHADRAAAPAIQAAPTAR